MPRSTRALTSPSRARYSLFAMVGLMLVILATGALAFNRHDIVPTQGLQDGVPNASATPTATPVPTVTPAPTAMPTPTATSTPSPSPSPRPAKTLLPGVAITVTPHGFEPQELTLSTGHFFLTVENRSSQRGLTLMLNSEQGDSIREFTQPEDALDWIDELQLTAGNYTLTTREHPDWVCHITVTQ